MAKKKEVATPAVENAKKVVDRSFDVIVSPVLTEKTMNLTQKQNKVTVYGKYKETKTYAPI